MATDTDRAAPIPPWRTGISRVDFHRIEVRGYPLADIIRNLRFPEVVYLAIRGELPDPARARVLEAALCSIVDHGFFAPTPLAARVIASATPESIMPAVAGALLTVGSVTVSPQHSAELILEALALAARDSLAADDAAARMVEECLRAKRRIPGLGHPLHPTGDPRAGALADVTRESGLWGEHCVMYDAVHRAFVARTGKPLPINIDGMLGAVLLEVGFAPREMAGIAALAFMPGIIAHAVEETAEGIRLRAADGEYTGPESRELPQAYRGRS